MGRECSLGIYVCNCNFLYIGGKKKFFGIVYNQNKNKNNREWIFDIFFSILKRKLGSCNNINPIETFSKVHLWSLGAKCGQFGQLMAIFWGQFMDTVASQYFLWVVFFLEMISLCFLIIIWIGVCNFLVKGPFLGNFKHSQSSGSLESASRVVRNVTFR